MWRSRFSPAFVAQQPNAAPVAQPAQAAQAAPVQTKSTALPKVAQPGTLRNDVSVFTRGVLHTGAVSTGGLPSAPLARPAQRPPPVTNRPIGVSRCASCS